jgi:hypothetical protein
MGTENIMHRQIIALSVVAVAATAQAECFVRSAMTAQTSVKVTAVADVQSLVVPISATQNKCIVNFRAQVDGKWITAEGENVGPKNVSEKMLCQGAMDQGRTQIMSRAEGNLVNLEQNMVCTDQKLPEVRKVAIGDHVQESEVLPHPTFPKRFGYKSTWCRWFIEPEVKAGDLNNRQGIICQLHDNDWQVVDKW